MEAPEWNDALRRYQIATALADADFSFGAFRQANRDFDMAKLHLRDRFGSVAKAKADPQAAKEWACIWSALTAAEEARIMTFSRPRWKAARELAMAPAPTLEAVRLKIEMIKSEELDNNSQMPGDPMAIIVEDLARLAPADHPARERMK